MYVQVQKEGRVLCTGGELWGLKRATPSQCLNTVTGRNFKNPGTETLRKHVTPLRKHDGKHVFPVADM